MPGLALAPKTGTPGVPTGLPHLSDTDLLLLLFQCFGGIPIWRTGHAPEGTTPSRVPQPYFLTHPTWATGWVG